MIGFGEFSTFRYTGIVYEDVNRTSFFDQLLIEDLRKLLINKNHRQYKNRKTNTRSKALLVSSKLFDMSTDSI